MTVHTLANQLLRGVGPQHQPEYRYAFYDLLSRQVIADHLPFTVPEYSRSLTEAGTVQSAALNLADERNRKLRPRDRTQPRRTTLVIFRDEVVVGEYLIWQRPPYKPTERKLQINASELTSYFGHRLLRPTGGPGSKKTLDFEQADQLAIFRALIADMQSVTYQDAAVGDIGLETDLAQTSGVLRDRHDAGDERGAFHGYEFRPYGELLDALANVDDGFEYRVDTYLDTDRQLRRVLRLGYPYLGHPPDADAYTLEYPGNVQDFEWPEDGTNSANAVFAIGAGEEVSMLWSEAYSPELATGYPLLERSTSYKSVSVQATLDGHATADVAALSGDITVPSFTVMGRPPVAPGDYVRVRISDEALFEGSDTHPFEVWMRAVQITTNPGPPETTTIAAEQPRTPGEGTA